MTRISNIRRVKFKNNNYLKGLDDLLTRAIKDPQPEDNILNQTALSMNAKIKYGEVNYYYNIITMDSESGENGIDNRCTACILHTTESLFWIIGSLHAPYKMVWSNHITTD